LALAIVALENITPELAKTVVAIAFFVAHPTTAFSNDEAMNNYVNILPRLRKIYQIAYCILVKIFWGMNIIHHFFQITELIKTSNISE